VNALSLFLKRQSVQASLARAALVLVMACFAFRDGMASSASGTGGKEPQFQCDSSGRSGAIGINVNNIGFPSLNSDQVISALSQSGAGWVRVSIFWGWTERQRGVFNWQEIDQGLSKLQAAHMSVLITITGPVPCWAFGTNTNCTSPRNTIPPVKEWTAFVTAVVQRYSHQVNYWEIWNEPDLIQSIDLPDATQRLVQYRDDILIPGAEAVHSADPNAKVVAPAFAAIPSGHTGMGPDLIHAFTMVMKGAGAHLVDIVSFHSYYPEDINQKAIFVHNAMLGMEMNSKPIWITEAGLHTVQLGIAMSNLKSLDNLNFAESKQAQFLTDQLNTVITHGNAQKVFWFALTDSTNGSGTHTNHYGLIDNSDFKTFSWKPRPAFLSLQGLVHSACMK
jgi:GH35 family endo-1,4-beta-xylanase